MAPRNRGATHGARRFGRVFRDFREGKQLRNLLRQISVQTSPTRRAWEAKPLLAKTRPGSLDTNGPGLPIPHLAELPKTPIRHLWPLGFSLASLNQKSILSQTIGAHVTASTYRTDGRGGAYASTGYGESSAIGAFPAFVPSTCLDVLMEPVGHARVVGRPGLLQALVMLPCVLVAIEELVPRALVLVDRIALQPVLVPIVAVASAALVLLSGVNR